MKDLLFSHSCYEILREISCCGRTRVWFMGEIDPDDRGGERRAATEELVRYGLVQPQSGYPDRAPHPFEPTDKAKEFLALLRTILADPFIDWQGFDSAFPTSDQEEDGLRRSVDDC